MSNFSFCHNVFNSFPFNYWDFHIILHRCFQNRLVQIWCMLEKGITLCCRYSKYWELWKRTEERIISTLWPISVFPTQVLWKAILNWFKNVTLFINTFPHAEEIVFKDCLLKRHQKASVCGRALRWFKCL